jgi:hypothetical protein
MENQYREIFSLLYGPVTRVVDYPPGESVRVLYQTLPRERPYQETEDDVVRQVIDEVERDGHYSIRPDAKYFLFVNLMQMVMIPLQLRERRNLDDVRSLLRPDVGLVVRDAARRTRGEEISGHIMLESVAANWKNLKLSDLRIWGED